MNRPSVHVVAGLLSIALAGHAPAAELAPSAAASPAPVAPESAPEAVAPRLPVQRMSPMVADLHAAIDEQREKIAKLRAELALARGGARALELQRALSAAKRETELRLLRIQADYARREGRLEAAGNLEAAITAMTAPPASREPASRPTPSRESDR
jgi:hypothetical protein